MGQNKSKNITDIVNEATASVIMKNMQNCASMSTQSQSLSNTGWAIGVSQTARSVINLNCASNFKMSSDIANQIASQISQDAQTQGIAVLDILKFNSTENITNIAARVSTNISTELVQNTLASLSQSQDISNVGVAIGVSQSLDATTVQKALADTVAKTNLATSISADTTQTASSTSTNPLSFIGDTMIAFVVLFIVFIAAIIAAVWFLFDD